MNDYKKYCEMIYPRGRFAFPDMKDVHVEHDTTREVLTFMWRGHRFLTLTPDDVFTLYALPCTDCNANRKYGLVVMKFRDGGFFWVNLDRTHHRNKANYLRIKADPVKDRWWVIKDSLPFTEGLRVRNCKVLNPEICRDYVKRVDKTRALDVRRKMKFFTDFVKGAAGMPGTFQDAGKVRHAITQAEVDKMTTDLICRTNFADPNFSDALKLFLVGTRKLDWRRYRSGTLDYNAAYQKDAITAGLKWLRQAMYEAEGLYQWAPVNRTY